MSELFEQRKRKLSISRQSTSNDIVDVSQTAMLSILLLINSEIISPIKCQINQSVYVKQTQTWLTNKHGRFSLSHTDHNQLTNQQTNSFFFSLIFNYFIHNSIRINPKIRRFGSLFTRRGIGAVRTVAPSSGRRSNCLVD